MIRFNEIPIAFREPGVYVEIDNSKAQQGLPAMPHVIVVLGQRLAAGAVAAGVPTRVTSAIQAETDFGRGSMLALMLAALKDVNRWTECWAIALDDDVAAVAATKVLTVTGPATGAGTLRLYVGGVRVQVAVAADDTAAEIAAALVAAVNANTALPVTAVAGDAPNQHVVTLTARNKGECGGDLDVRLNYWFGDRTPAGVAVGIAAGVAGSGNPDVADAIAAMASRQYHTIVLPYTDAANLSAMEAELLSRFGPMDPKEGMAYAAADGTHGALSTLGESRNSPFVPILGLQNSPAWPPVAAAVLAGAVAAEEDPARPLQTLPLTGVLAPAEADRYDTDERNLHLYDGVSTLRVDGGGNVSIGRLITTYKTNALGAPDVSYLNVETMRTLFYLRYSLRAWFAQKYPRAKLADDDPEVKIDDGQAVMTPNLARAECVTLFRKWQKAGLVENYAQFERDLLVERDETDRDRLNIVLPPDLVNQLRILAASIQFRL